MCRLFLLTFLLTCEWKTQAGEPDFSALDVNGNSVIEPEEIPANDFTVIARYASLASLDVSNPMPIGALQEGRQQYLRQLDNSGKDLRLAGKNEFGRLSGTTVRPFGNVGTYIDTYTPDVRGGTIVTFQKFDANRDGLLTRAELSIAYRLFAELWMRGDGDGNGILTFSELANAIAADRERRINLRDRAGETWNVNGVEITPEHRAYAARLMNKFDKNENGRLEDGEIPKEWKTGNVLLWADRNRDGRVTRTEMQTGAARFLQEEQLAEDRKSDPDMQHCVTLAASLIGRFDLDKDRTLNRSEWQRIGGEIAESDLNENGLIVAAELSTWLLGRVSSQPGSDLPESLPHWFLESDADMDAQVTLAELFAAQSSRQIAEFSDHDANADGIVTSAECSRRGGAGKSRYASGGPRVLEAEKEVYSDVFVPDAITILDVDVQVSIVKDGDDDVDIRLIGPRGTTAVLYYTNRLKAWGGGPMFNDTVIDDEAPRSAQRLPRPPAHRSFRPQSMGNAELLSLSAFYGTSAKGRWRLVVGNKAQNRGRNAGLLEGWALLIKPSPQHRAGMQSTETGSGDALASIEPTVTKPKQSRMGIDDHE